jgi:hypothetical protein
MQQVARIKRSEIRDGMPCESARAPCNILRPREGHPATLASRDPRLRGPSMQT